MLKSHIKEELMEGKEDDSVYESMAHVSTDLLMKCSLNPGCEEELYESMAGMIPGATEDLCTCRVSSSCSGILYLQCILQYQTACPYLSIDGSGNNGGPFS